MNLKLKFKPVSHSWVALHPKPKGVIQFIAGAFFGTFGIGHWAWGIGH